MILLEFNNKIIFELVQKSMEPVPDGGKRDVLDVSIADFDGVSFHITTPDTERRGLVRFSIRWPCIESLLEHGGTSDLQQIYGPLLEASPESGYDVSLLVDFDSLPDNAEERERLPLKISFLKRHLLAAPFKKMFGAVFNKKNPSECVYVQYRNQTDEAFWIKGSGDSCTVVYSIRFTDKSDKVLAKVFLQEFADARRSMRGVPAVTYSLEPPLELQGEVGVPEGDDVGFVTMVLFENHLNPKNAFKTINLVQTFRDYLHYHIKCSKAYMHTRMRAQVTTWLQVLNRARTEPHQRKEKKLASGRTFKRK